MLNSYLEHGGGVAAAIVKKAEQSFKKKATRQLQAEVLFQLDLAVITSAGKLPCKAVIHTVGPRMGEGNEDYKLRKAVRSSLILASEKGFRSISMPAISSGIFGFPKDRCAKILVEESKSFLQGNNDDDSNSNNNNNNTISILHIIEFCIFDSETLDYFKNQFDNIKNTK